MRAISGVIVICLLTLVVCSGAAAQEKLPFKTPRSLAELAPQARIITTKGEFEVSFLRDKAPTAVKNFQYLAQKKFFNNTVFYHYDPEYSIQGGDPKGDGSGGPGYTLPPEFSDSPHRKGTVGMARLPNRVNPERRSQGSQFYICLQDSPHLDGLYTVFAQVSRGIEVVESLRKGDKIVGVNLIWSLSKKELKR